MVRKKTGSIGVGHYDRHNAEVINDLNLFPYPFESDSIDPVYLDKILEHLDKPIQVMEEVHCITKLRGA